MTGSSGVLTWLAGDIVLAADQPRRPRPLVQRHIGSHRATALNSSSAANAGTIVAGSWPADD